MKWIRSACATRLVSSAMCHPHWCPCEPTGRRSAPPEDKLREAISRRHALHGWRLLRRCVPRNGDYPALDTSSGLRHIRCMKTLSSLVARFQTEDDCKAFLAE